MATNNDEIVYTPITFEIHSDGLGRPYLKKVERRRNVKLEGRGTWVPVGRDSDTGIAHVVAQNRKNGMIVLPSEDGIYRVLVLTE